MTAQAGRAERGIVERVQIRGVLVMETPAHFGGGDVVGPADMTLLRDAMDGQSPLLPGASLAGALRTYLREYEHGYGQPGDPKDLAGRLFGAIAGKKSVQSWLLVDDSLGQSPGVELRNGVAIDAKTRTAAEKKLFDMELLQAGTTFDISLEFLRTGENGDLLPALAVALRGLQEGEIHLGLRKRRGLGRCRVGEWRVRRYRLTTAEGLVAWLDDRASAEESGSDIVALLGVALDVPDGRERFDLEADFELESSILIRSGGGGPNAPDMIHLHSPREGSDRPIVSGTSLAGAIRARALRIANTLHGREAGRDLVDGMFGRRIEGRDDKPSGSRVLVEEGVLEGTRDLVQSRVKIDRFTGGSYPGALFSQQPAFGGVGSSLGMELSLRQPRDAEIGLLLLVLKDLWTGDLPLGGESGVGRGRLKGVCANLALRRRGQAVDWMLERSERGLDMSGSGTAQDLERYVSALAGYGRVS